MTHHKLDARPSALEAAAIHPDAAQVHAHAVPTPKRRRAWGPWAGVIAIGALTLLALIQGLSSEAWAATLQSDVPALPDNLASTLSTEIAEALPFL